MLCFPKSGFHRTYKKASNFKYYEPILYLGRCGLKQKRHVELAYYTYDARVHYSLRNLKGFLSYVKTGEMK